MFDPFLPALAGGLLIGLSASLMMFALGRVTGISGIFINALAFARQDGAWQPAFLLGLVAGPLGLYTFTERTAPLPSEAALPLTIAAGLLVGFGVRLGSGCTSGHGVCGLARLSPRSLAATATFMGVGAGVVYAIRHGLGGGA